GNPPRSISPASRTMKKVIQPYFTINDYPTTSTDTVFNRPYGLETKKLLRHDLLKDLHRGWKKYLEELVKSDKEEGPFVSVAELKNRLSVRFPPMDESQRRKAEKKREIKRRNKDNLDRVEKPKTMRGRKVRTGSFVASKKLVESIKATTTFQENEQTLTTTFQATALGQTHELTTGNYFQSALVFYQSTLPQNATGVRLEGHYHRVNEGQGAPGQIPTNPFLQTDLRLRRTQTHGDGSYQIDEVVDSPSLDALEMVRFLENIVSVSGRYVLYQQGQITQIQLHNPVGVYALHEVPKATTGCPRTNALLNQNTTAIIEALKSLPPDTIIGQHAGSFPDSTKMATVKSFIDALEAVEREHNKETQNEYHRQMFRISRAQVGPIITQSGEKEVPGTPPGSPFNPDYGYDKNL
ncbi:MAG TPA: hypothetical protein VFC63_08425, partial [Blastocatellia bacterium]|nr:hypothetical protein [Blastocatellia bacterium]